MFLLHVNHGNIFNMYLTGNTTHSISAFISDTQIFLISNLIYPNIENKLITQLEQFFFTTLRKMLKRESRKCHIFTLISGEIIK